MKIKVLNNGCELPIYATPGSSGVDLSIKSIKKLFKGQEELEVDKIFPHYRESGSFILRPQERVLVGTGLYAEIPLGYELQVRPRSGISLKKGITVVNTPGTVDFDYRGEIGVILINTSSKNCKLFLDERIAQMVCCKVEQPIYEFTEELSNTSRNEGGFGSTGK